MSQSPIIKRGSWPSWLLTIVYWPLLPTEGIPISPISVMAPAHSKRGCPSSGLRTGGDGFGEEAQGLAADHGADQAVLDQAIHDRDIALFTG